MVVVDGRPWREGREMLRRLVECGLDCSYVLVSAASFIMREVCILNPYDDQKWVQNVCLHFYVSLLLTSYLDAIFRHVTHESYSRM